MIFSQLRASAWKYGALVLAVLVVAAVIAAVVFRFDAIDANTRAATAQEAAQRLAGQLADARRAAQRDELSSVATTAARRSADDRLTQHNDRAERVAEIANAPREPVPAVCPGPDPSLLRESQEGADRIRAGTRQLRGLRDSTGEGAGTAGTD